MGEGTALSGPHTPRATEQGPKTTTQRHTHTTGAQGTAEEAAGAGQTAHPREPGTQVGTWRSSWFRLGPQLC